MRVRPGDLDADGFGEVPQAAGGRVPVHPGAPGVQQDRPAVPEAYSPVDGPADRGRQRDQDHLGAFAAHAQDPVAVLLAEVGDVGAGGFEDPQAQQAEHRHKGEVARVRRVPGGGEQGLELQVREPTVRRGQPGVPIWTSARFDLAGHGSSSPMVRQAIGTPSMIMPCRIRCPDTRMDQLGLDHVLDASPASAIIDSAR